MQTVRGITLSWLRYSGIIVSLLLTAACSGAATVSGNTPTSTVLPFTPTAQPTCASLLPGSGPATAGANFSDVSFPENSVSTPIVLHTSGTGRFTISLFDVCSPNTSVAAVDSFYATSLTSHGWAYAPTLPFDGGYQKACGDPNCWGKGAAPRYVGLEKVTATGNNLVKYSLRLFVPPPVPNCPVGPFTGPGGPFVAFFFNKPDLPVPPLTETGPGDGFDQANFSQSNGSMCSSGTAASITSFFAAELPNLGWVNGPPPAGCITGGGSGTWWIKNNRAFKATVPASGGYNPGAGWGYDYCEPV